MTFYENKFAAKLFNYNIFRFSTALESKIKEFGKYTAASFLSTCADYSAFYVLLLTSIPTVSATILSHIVGSIVAFVLLFKWVFRFAEKHDVEPLILKFPK